jgi:hypothetical protein
LLSLCPAFNFGRFTHNDKRTCLITNRENQAIAFGCGLRVIAHIENTFSKAVAFNASTPEIIHYLIGDFTMMWKKRKCRIVESITRRV